MRGHISYKALIAGMTAVAISAGTVLAQSQQVPAGIQMTLDVLQRFSAGDNLSRSSTPSGNGFLSSTALTFGLSSETRNQDLSLEIGATARMGDLPDEGGRINEMANPSFALEYERRGRDTVLSFDASVQEIALRDTVISFDDFEELDLDDIVVDGGTRKQESVNLRFVTGEGGPVETRLGLQWSARSFDSTDASLVDQERLRFNGSVRLAVARNTDVILGLESIEQKRFDTNTRTVDTLRYRIGVATDIAPGTNLEVQLGSSTIDVVDGAINTSDSAMTARAELTHDMPNGNIGVLYTRTHGTTGTRDTLRFSRALELKSGAVDFSLGTTRGEDGGSSPVASVSYRQELRNGVAVARLQKGVSGNASAEEFSNLSANVRYLHQLTELVQLDFNLQRTQIEQIAGGGNEERERTVASVAVNYDLTADWALSAGLRHEAQATDGVTTLEANEVFATFQRSFDLSF